MLVTGSCCVVTMATGCDTGQTDEQMDGRTDGRSDSDWVPDQSQLTCAEWSNKGLENKATWDMQRSKRWEGERAKDEKRERQLHPIAARQPIFFRFSLSLFISLSLSVSLFLFLSLSFSLSLSLFLCFSFCLSLSLCLSLNSICLSLFSIASEHGETFWGQVCRRQIMSDRRAAVDKASNQ